MPWSLLGYGSTLSTLLFPSIRLCVLLSHLLASCVYHSAPIFHHKVLTLWPQNPLSPPTVLLKCLLKCRHRQLWLSHLSPSRHLGLGLLHVVGPEVSLPIWGCFPPLFFPLELTICIVFVCLFNCLLDFVVDLGIFWLLLLDLWRDCHCSSHLACLGPQLTALIMFGSQRHSQR